MIDHQFLRLNVYFLQLTTKIVKQEFGFLELSEYLFGLVHFVSKVDTTVMEAGSIIYGGIMKRVSQSTGGIFPEHPSSVVFA